MNDRLKERITNYVNWLEEEYAEKPRKWWQGNRVRHLTTQSLSTTTWNENDPPEVIIKYDRKKALRNSAFFLFISLIILLLPIIDGTAKMSELFNSMLILLLILIVSSKELFNKRPQIFFCKQGFWINGSMKNLVSWKDLITAYIIIEESGEDTVESVELHYYDESEDLIVKTKRDLRGLDTGYKKIASYIEYWKKQQSSVAGIVS